MLGHSPPSLLTLSDIALTEATISCYRQEIEQVCTDPLLATDALRLVASPIQLGKLLASTLV